MGDSWAEVYYEALQFYYYEPMHLGQQKKPGAKYDSAGKVDEGLRRKEVPLNHLIKLFLSLAPVALRNRLFSSALGSPRLGEFQMAGRSVDADYVLQNAVQPDFLFKSGNETISIEMKVDAQSDIDQVLKYALLAIAVEMREMKEMQHSLIYLAKGMFEGLWKQKFQSVENLREALNTIDKSVFLKSRPKHFRDRESRFVEIVDSISIGFINYEDLAGLMATEEGSLGSTAGDEVYRNLLAGMQGELKRRGLAS